MIQEASPYTPPREVEGEESSSRLVCLSLPAQGIGTADFLRQARGNARFLWANPARPGLQPGAADTLSTQVTLAGFGIAAELFSWSANRFHSIQEQARTLFDGATIAYVETSAAEGSQIMPDQCPPLAMPRLFGGFAFQDDFTPDNTWAAFHPAHFILPHYQLARWGDDCWLTINTLLPSDEDPYAILPELKVALEARLVQLQTAATSTPTPTTPATAESKEWDIRYPMTEQQWAKAINTAVAHMRQGPLKKVVLSRVCEILQEEDIDIEGALAYLGRRYDDCFIFLFEPQPGHAFLGATPELLVNVSGEQITTMALAGSAKRGATAAEDNQFAQELFNSSKDRYEHELVVRSIRARLADKVEALTIPPKPTVYRLNNIQHLYTPIHGRLRAQQGVLPLVESLHPTPAMGGTPRELALGFIQSAEPVPRGWYAAPIGWIDHQLDGAFAVAIRSAVCQQRRAWLYAGAGIVADSLPEREWQETALKFRPMLEALLGERLETGD